jgi:large subunit ribosomal protein L7/L12
MIRSSMLLVRAAARSASCTQLALVDAVGPSTSRFCSNQAADSTEPIGNEKVQRLADEIVGLTVLECSWLSELLRKKLNLQKPAFGAMPMMQMAGAAAAPAAAAEAEPEVKKEKTEFNVKLDSFSPDGKIKVIKEVRAATSLGLKEAKELVRSVTQHAMHA